MPPRRPSPHTPVAAVFGDEFRMGPGYGTWRPGGSGDWLLILTEGGSGRIVADGREHLTRPGELLLYEPRAAQDYGTAPRAGRWHLLWAHFVARPSWQAWLQWPSLAPQVRLLALPAEARAACRDALRRMAKACRHPGPVGTELAMTALQEALLWGRASCARPGNAAAADPRIAQATAWLTDHFKEPFRVPELARRCGLSVSRFSHLFRRDTGQTAGQFAEQLRLSHAAHLLRLTSLGVAQVAAECGFDDPFHFTHRFRRRHGRSPRAFRAAAERASR